MGVCPTDWMLLVGVLRITGTLIYTARGTARKSGSASCLCELMIALRFECQCGGSRFRWVCADVQFVIDFSEQQIQKFLMVRLFLACGNAFHEGSQILNSMAEIACVFICIEYILAA